MGYDTMVKVATISLWNYFALIINVIAFVMIYVKASKSESLKAFFVVQGSMMIWLVGKIFKTVSPTEDLRWFFIVVYYFGICLLEVSFLDFAYVYFKGELLHKKIRRIIYSVALIQFSVVASNPYHFLFYSRYGFWGDDFGPLFYVHVVINYSFILLGMILCGIKFKKQISKKKIWQRHLIEFAIIVPLLFNFVYITRILESFFDYLQIQVFDITPIIYTWSILVFVYATFKYEFFDITPIMKHEVSNSLSNPVAIVDNNLNILYTNNQFDVLLNGSESIFKKINVQQTTERVISYGSKYYSYFISRHKSLDGERFIVCFTDVTSYEIAKIALNDENKELTASNQLLENQIEIMKQTSHIGARNYIARELHDILGHSLVVTIKLLEVSKMYYKTKRDRAFESLEKAIESIESGFEEMKAIKTKDTSAGYNTEALRKELNSILKGVEYAGIDVNFFMRGKKRMIEEKVYDSLRKVIKELTTNTLKHSEASKLLLSVMINETNMVIQTMDNGRGVNKLVKGNGLKGIDERLSMINGKAKYTCVNNEGFVVNITIDL